MYVILLHLLVYVEKRPAIQFQNLQLKSFQVNYLITKGGHGKMMNSRGDTWESDVMKLWEDSDMSKEDTKKFGFTRQISFSTNVPLPASALSRFQKILADWRRKRLISLNNSSASLCSYRWKKYITVLLRSPASDDEGFYWRHVKFVINMFFCAASPHKIKPRVSLSKDLIAAQNQTLFVWRCPCCSGGFFFLFFFSPQAIRQHVPVSTSFTLLNMHLVQSETLLKSCCR